MSNINTFRSTKGWNVRTYNTGSSLWQTVTKWPSASMNAMTRRYESTFSVVDLADGGQGIFVPEVKKRYPTIEFTWHPRTITSTFRTNLKTYQNSHIGLEITLHDNTIIEGYITAIDEEYPLSGSTQMYGLKAEFQQFDVDNDGIIGN